MNDKEKTLIFEEVFQKEIDALKEAKQNLNSNDILAAAELINGCRGKVLFIGLGKSGYIGEKISASFSSMGIPSFFIHVTELFHGDFGRVEDDDVLVLLSHSGETVEVVSAGNNLKQRGNKIISITSKKTSSLSKLSDVSLNYEVSVEADHLNKAPTNSSTITLVIGDALMVLVSKLREYSATDFLNNHPGGSLGKAKDIKK
ncbi:MAG: SIS domain-containing protein [Acholeplasmataceae bacterium]|jgi:arabinose-5-phosphate isomerase|nr:SIS domain-containing protein [Acholeplasmataceae bacterium]